MPTSAIYRGRFAPSPTGPLHFGSLAAAVGSYLDARHHNGIWLVRMEDLDAPRCVPDAADDILRTLEAFGLHWDEPVIYQSRRSAAYREAFERLRAAGYLYPCACSRKEIADSAMHGIDGPVYPGTCRNGLPPGKEARAWRVRTGQFPSPLSLPPSQAIEFDDALQGHIAQHLESEVGDFVVKRADGLFAYQLAVVADDATQGITDVVRGADLLHSTPRQIYLQRLLGFATPAYMHLPVAVNAQGEKLSKQTRAEAVGQSDIAATFYAAIVFLRQQPPAELRHGDLQTIMDWAVANWRANAMSGVLNAPEPTRARCD